MNEYDSDFYKLNLNGSMRSAAKIVPYVIEMLEPIKINSAVDFGCGVGGWLAAFKQMDSQMSVLGLDFGKPRRNQLQIEETEYKTADLSKRTELGKRYDICVSLEVAEHISRENADQFIDNLCRSSDIVLFSAAIQGQGGTGHINEQQLSYWVQKFRQRNFKCVDCIRSHFWKDKSVETWYKQNAVLFINENIDTAQCRFNEFSDRYIMDIVHPELARGIRRETDERFVNWNYLYLRNKKLFLTLRKIKRFFKR